MSRFLGAGLSIASSRINSLPIPCRTIDCFTAKKLLSFPLDACIELTRQALLITRFSLLLSLIQVAPLQRPLSVPAADEP